VIAGIPDILYDKGIFARADSGVYSYNNAGSDLDIRSSALLAGGAGGRELSFGHLAYTGFFIVGQGSYDTYNSFASGAIVRGSGSSSYTGLGALVRLDFNGTGAAENDKSHPYVEAHIQGGQSSTNFYSDDITDTRGRGSEYKISSGYAGGHIGVGYIKDLGNWRELDLYAKYLMASLGGDDTEISTGDSIRFGASISRRMRVGARYKWRAGDFHPYIGAAWEHEFDGAAKTWINGFSVDAPSMVGDTGIFEAGFIYDPPDSPWSIELGMSGSTGVREGVTGTVRIEYKF
jgi:hypothetical protein